MTPDKTMTVKQLIAKLIKYKEDTPVYAVWEGTINRIDKSNFDLIKVSEEDVYKRGKVSSLFIGVDK